VRQARKEDVNEIRVPHMTQSPATPLYYATLCGFRDLVDKNPKTNYPELRPARASWGSVSLQAQMEESTLTPSWSMYSSLPHPRPQRAPSSIAPPVDRFIDRAEYCHLIVHHSARTGLNQTLSNCLNYDLI
jgi:hypothetical protein